MISGMRWLSGCLALVLWVSGCASSEVVQASGPRPAISPTTVKIYQAPPKKYEKHGLIRVPVTGEVRWDARGDANAGFEQLKAQAANKGANGVLLVVEPKDFDIAVTAGYMGTFYQVPVKENPRAAVAEAIYMLEEK